MRLVQDTPQHERSGVTVVSDDRALRDRAHRVGAHTERLSWIEGLIGLPTSKAGAIGSGAPPRQTGASGNADEEAERKSWTPGRGATKKRGNPRRRGRQG
jgi:hypothetical protein